MRTYQNLTSSAHQNLTKPDIGSSARPGEMLKNVEVRLGLEPLETFAPLLTKADSELASANGCLLLNSLNPRSSGREGSVK